MPGFHDQRTHVLTTPTGVDACRNALHPCASTLVQSLIGPLHPWYKFHAEGTKLCSGPKTPSTPLSFGKKSQPHTSTGKNGQYSTRALPSQRTWWWETLSVSEDPGLCMRSPLVHWNRIGEKVCDIQTLHGPVKWPQIPWPLDWPKGFPGPLPVPTPQRGSKGPQRSTTITENDLHSNTHTRKQKLPRHHICILFEIYLNLNFQCFFYVACLDDYSLKMRWCHAMTDVRTGDDELRALFSPFFFQWVYPTHRAWSAFPAVT